MPLELMYITNKPEVAKIAENSGVDRIWIDLEILGKQERQKGRNTVISNHTLDDIKEIKSVITKSKIQVRVNPINPSSKIEIETAIEYGADILMLPMFKTVDEVQYFIDIVNKRAKVLLLLETKEAVEIIDQIISLDGIDEVHVGLNDLHLSYKKTFMFELLIDGTLDYIASKFKSRSIKFGFGGIARLNHGMVPAEYVICHHYAIGSKMAILSRSFCDANYVDNPKEIAQLFEEGISNIRRAESEYEDYTIKQFEENKNVLAEKINLVVKKMKDERK